MQVLLENAEGQTVTLSARYRTTVGPGPWVLLPDITTSLAEETFPMAMLMASTQYEVQVATDDAFDPEITHSLLFATLVPEGLPPPTFRLELHTALQDRIRFNVILSRALAPGEEPLTLYLRAFAGTDQERFMVYEWPVRLQHQQIDNSNRADS